ncbi:uncharacterized protein LOC143232873 [Tachypleus tridentatus]|uniref:uncharacterized protein LOC143232873 n=1 Tax=Tachypleus tridentatus TaxID=6853 RepID=UPI003FD2F398
MDPTTTTLSKDEVALRFQENWKAKIPEDDVSEGTSPHVDDGLTSLNWLQNLNIMTKLGAPTPPTPPASPVPLLDPKGDNKSGCDDARWKTDKAGEDIDYKTNGSVKPPFSYATLICMAMKANKNKMTLSSIYKWIRENFMYYKNADPSWQNSIRHNLSLNKSFIKVPRSKDEPGKGGFWKLDPNHAKSLVDGVFKKRRPAQKRPNSGFPKKVRKEKNAKFPTENKSQLASDIIQDTPPGSAGSNVCMNGELHSIADSLGRLTDTAPKKLSSVLNMETINFTLTIPDEPVAADSNSTGIVHHNQEKDEFYSLDEGLQDNLNVLLNYPYTELEAFQKLQCSEEATLGSQSNTLMSPSPLLLEHDFFPTNTNDSPLPNDLDLSSSSATETLQFPDQGANLLSSDWWSGFQQTQNDLLCLTPSLLNFSLPPSSSSNPSHLGENSSALYSSVLTLPASPSGAGFDQQMAVQETGSQPWADCKAALEAAALDLESFNDFDTSHVF